MDFNPMTLLPLMMSGKGDNNSDVAKMLTAMNAMKSGSPDAILGMLPIDPKLKGMLEIMKTARAAEGTAVNTQSVDGAAMPTPDGVLNNELSYALKALLDK